MSSLDAAAVIAQCEALLEQCKTLQLATVNAAGEPCASYAPYLWHKGAFYILVSGLAEHTASLLTGKAISLMVIRDEAQTRNLFARERLVVTAQPAAWAEDTQLLDLLEARQGNTVQLLRTLPDFGLVKLTPIKTHYVAGFGKAYAVDLDAQTVEHRTR